MVSKKDESNKMKKFRPPVSKAVIGKMNATKYFGINPQETPVKWYTKRQPK